MAFGKEFYSDAVFLRRFLAGKVKNEIDKSSGRIAHAIEDCSKLEKAFKLLKKKERDEKAAQEAVRKDEEKEKAAVQQSVETHKTNELNTSLKQDVATLMVMGTGELIDQNVVQSKTSSSHNPLVSNTVNDAAPELTGTPATLAKGKEDTSYILKEVDLLQGFSDIDGDQLQITGLRP